MIHRSLSFLFVVSILVCESSLAQDILLERVRLEVVRTQRQYDDFTRVTAFQGEKLPIVEFEAEFENASDVVGIELQLPNSSIVLRDSMKQGDILRLMDFVNSTSISLFRGTYTLTVEPSQGEDILYQFDVDFDLTEDFPEVRYPIDGLDQVDEQSLDADWDASGDSNRLDLFDFPLAGFHRTFRSDFEDFDLGAEVDRDEAYELWIGSTVEETGDTDGGFDVEVWFTSSSVLIFSTGPRRRDQLSEYNSNELIISASVVNRVKRVGQFSNDQTQNYVARVEGTRLFDIEVGRIRGPEDGHLENNFVRLDPVVSRNLYEREINAKPGEDYLFLVEFLELFGSQTTRVADTLTAYPEVTAPMSNESGLGSTLDVEWDWSGPTVLRFEVSLQEIGSSTETDHIIVPVGQPREAQFTGLEDDREYQLQVSAHTEARAESITCIAISTGKAGDANNDGTVDGVDLFGQTLVWYSNLPDNQTFPSQTALSRLDLNGDEKVDGRDLIQFLEELR